MTTENLERQGKNSFQNSELDDNSTSRQTGKELTVRELVERFKKQPGNDKLIARWQQPIPLK